MTQIYHYLYFKNQNRKKENKNTNRKRENRRNFFLIINRK